MADNTSNQNDTICSAIERHENSQVVSRDHGHQKTSTVTYRPPLDLYDLNDHYEVHVDLPGSSKDTIDVTLEEGTLTIEAAVPDRYAGNITPLHGEFGIGNYRRQIRLGEDIDSEALEAAYANGVLTITLPKKAERQPRRIEVRAAD